MAKQVFKQYNQDQYLLFPPSLDELIPQSHFVRFINSAVESLDIKPIILSYKGGGTSSYHPLMMIKIIVYAYLNKIYTCRKIAKVLSENIHFMWLSAMTYPDFHTINNFRIRLKDYIDNIFASLLEILSEEGYINLKDYFIDGTKIEANANKHSHVWKKNTLRYKENTNERIQALLDHIEKLNCEENEKYGDSNLEEFGENKDLNSNDLKQKIQDFKQIIDQKTQKDDLDKEQKKKVCQTKQMIKKLEKEELPKLEKYEEQEKNLNGRNSYSKTDLEATFFRMKDQRLLPAYNVLLGTENQFIINYSVHQNAGESGLFVAHMEKLKGLIDNLPERAVGDSAYGSLENYDYLEENSIENYLKYNTFYKECSKNYIKNPFNKDNFTYCFTEDYYICPNQKKLTFKEEKQYISDNGYESEIRIYQCEDCSSCPYADKCKKGKSNRSIQINRALERHKYYAKSNLISEEGINLRKRRNVDVETVFGQIKHNMGYRRFILRGLEKVNLEMGILAIGHNLQKMFKEKLQEAIANAVQMKDEIKNKISRKRFSLIRFFEKIIKFLEYREAVSIYTF